MSAIHGNIGKTPDQSLTTGKTVRLPKAIRQPIEVLLRQDLARAMAAIRTIDDDATPAQMQKVANAVRLPLGRVDLFAGTYYMKIGRLLIEIQDRMPHGGWMRLFKDATGGDKLLEPINMSVQKAEALMRMARLKVLQEPAVLKALPLHAWRTTDEVARADAATIRKAVKDGRIRPTMTRKQAEALRHGDDAQIPRARDPFAAIRRALELYDGDKAVLVEFVQDWLRAMTGEVEA